MYTRHPSREEIRPNEIMRYFVTSAAVARTSCRTGNSIVSKRCTKMITTNKVHTIAYPSSVQPLLIVLIYPLWYCHPPCITYPRMRDPKQNHADLTVKVTTLGLTSGHVRLWQFFVGIYFFCRGFSEGLPQQPAQHVRSGQ